MVENTLRACSWGSSWERPRYLPRSVPGGLYIRAVIPLLTSLPDSHSRECVKQMQLSEERRDERLGSLLDEFGGLSRAACQTESVAETLTRGCADAGTMPFWLSSVQWRDLKILLQFSRRAHLGIDCRLSPKRRAIGGSANQWMLCRSQAADVPVQAFECSTKRGDL